MTDAETLVGLIKEWEDVQNQQALVLDKMEAIIKRTRDAGNVKDIEALKKKLLGL